MLGILFPPAILLLDFKTYRDDDQAGNARDTHASEDDDATDHNDDARAQRKRSFRTLFGGDGRSSARALLRHSGDVDADVARHTGEEEVCCECERRQRSQEYGGDDNMRQRQKASDARDACFVSLSAVWACILTRIKRSYRVQRFAQHSLCLN